MRRYQYQLRVCAGSGLVVSLSVIENIREALCTLLSLLQAKFHAFADFCGGRLARARVPGAGEPHLLSRSRLALAAFCDMMGGAYG